MRKKLTILEAAYRRMAQDKDREAQALQWAEATVGDVADESRGKGLCLR